MLRPEYQHQYNNGIYQDIMARNAIQDSVPSMKRVFQESVRYAFEDNTFMHAKDYLRTLQAPEDSKLLTKEQYNNSLYARPQTSWYEGITEKQAQVLAERHDKEVFYSTYTQNVGAFDLGRVAGLIVGGAPDPINYIPFLGLAGRFSKIARVVDKMPVLGLAANSMMSQTAFETAKYSAIASIGGDINYKAAVMDVAIAGLIGGGAGLLFGGLGSNSGLSKKVSESDFSKDLIVSGVMNGDRLSITGRGKTIVSDIYDKGQLLLSNGSEKIDDMIVRTQEIKKQESVLDFVEPTNKPDIETNLVVQDITTKDVSSFSEALRKTKSCLLGLFK